MLAFYPLPPFFATQIKPLFVADQLFVLRTFMLRSFDLVVPLLLGLAKLLLRSILTSPDLSDITHFKANTYGSVSAGREKWPFNVILAVQDSSIGDLVSQSLSESLNHLLISGIWEYITVTLQ